MLLLAVLLPVSTAFGSQVEGSTASLAKESAEKTDHLDLLNGAVVRSYSSQAETATYAATTVIDGTPDTGWSTLVDAPFPHELVIELRQPVATELSGVFDTNYDLLLFETYGSGVVGCYDWDDGKASRCRGRRDDGVADPSPGSIARMHLRSFAFGLMVLPLCLSSGGYLGAVQTPDTEGHQRMVAVLAEIAGHADHQERYEANVRPIEAALARLPPDAPPAQRAQMLTALAQSALNAGDPDKAIVSLQEAREHMASMARVDPGLAVSTRLLHGVARLRIAEDRACIEQVRADGCILGLDPGAEPPGAHQLELAVDQLLPIVRGVPSEHPFHVVARWLANIAAMLGGDRVELPASVRIERSAFGDRSDFPRFHNVAPRVGLATLSQAGGAVLDDLDGDELLDVMVSSADPAAPLRVFRNTGDGGFEEITDRAGVAGITGGLNLVSADYDADGDLDVYVLRGAWKGEGGRWPNSLLRNDGSARFRDVTFEVGLGDVHYPTQAAAWADFDLDGDLDLYVGNEAQPSQPYPGQLFENRRGRFVDVAADAGVENLRFAKGVTWGDYDEDGDPDLFVSNMGGANRLYRNRNDGTFVDVAEEAGVTTPVHGFVAWFWDVDHDGHLDLFVNAYEANWQPGEPPPVWKVAADRFGADGPAEAPALYLGDGRGGFRDIAEEAGLAIHTMPMGAGFGDLDNDGWLDFYLGTGYPGLEAKMPNVMYRNRGGSAFDEVTLAGGFGHLAKGHGVAFGDVDHDGDQDVFEQLGGMMPGDRSYDVLFENPGFGNHWVKLRLLGREGRTPYGARVILQLSTPDGRRSITRFPGSVGSFGAGPRRLEIGLADAERIESLRIRWPGAAEEQVFADLEVDRFYEVRQGDDAARIVPLERFSLR